MKPTIITLTGPSCSGKSTLEKLLKEAGFSAIISTTTRKPRFGEFEGKTYYFLDKSEFKRQAEMGAFVENVEFNNQHYGATVKEVERVAAIGCPIVIVCEPIGQRQIESYCQKVDWNCLSVFIDAPDALLMGRWLRRYTEDIDCSGPDRYDATTDLYASRLTHYMQAERAWAAEIHRYDIHIDQFDADTQDYWLQLIADDVRAFGAQPHLALAF